MRGGQPNGSVRAKIKERAVRTLALSHRLLPAREAGPLVLTGILMLRRLKRRVKARADRRVLQHMPDYLLKDIGLSRSSIAGGLEFGRTPPHVTSGKRVSRRGTL